MKYKRYILLKMYESIYITKGNYMSILSFPTFQAAIKYIDAHENVELYPPQDEFSSINTVKNVIRYCIYLWAAFILYYYKYSAVIFGKVYLMENVIEFANLTINVLIAVEAFRFIKRVIKYIYIYYGNEKSKIFYAENCTKKDLAFILFDKTFEIFVLMCMFIMMRFTSSLIFGLLPFTIFLISIARWQRSINYKKI